MLHLAWETAIGALANRKATGVFEQEVFPEQVVTLPGGKSFVVPAGPLGGGSISTEKELADAEVVYWRVLQPALGNSLSLVQQSIEMGLKGRIAAVSPYLLIANQLREYPKETSSKDTPFSEFRSVDAANLIRVHNLVCDARFSEQFVTAWHQLRRQRNILIHSVAPSATLLRSEEIIEHILAVSHEMHQGERWFWRRIKYSFDEFETAYGSSEEWIYGAVLNEFQVALRYLPKEFARDYFSLQSGGRTYYCPQCKAECRAEHWDEEEMGRYAQLPTRSVGATELRCVICERTSQVVRKQCSSPGCRSNRLRK